MQASTTGKLWVSRATRVERLKVQSSPSGNRACGGHRRRGRGRFGGNAMAEAGTSNKRQDKRGSLAGAAHLLNDNAGVLRGAQREQKSLVEQKGKSSLDFDFQCEYKL